MTVCQSHAEMDSKVACYKEWTVKSHVIEKMDRQLVLSVNIKSS